MAVTINVNRNGLVITGDGTKLYVTGSSRMDEATLTGLGTITLIREGNNIYVSGAAAASSDSATNLGNGSGVFYQKAGGNFQFKSLKAGPNIAITGSTSELYISGGGGGSTDLTDLETATGYLNTNKLEISDLTSASGTLGDRLGSTGSNLLGQIQSNDTDISNLQTASGYLNTNKIEISDLSSASGVLNDAISSVNSSVLSNDQDISELQTASGYLNSNKSIVQVTGNALSTANLSGVGNVAVDIIGSQIVRISGSTSASSDTASNIGNGSGLFFQKSAGDFQFKSLRAGPNITITGTTSELYISGGGGGGSTDLTDLETATGYLNTNKLEISDLTSASGTLSDRLGSTGSNLLGQITSNDADISNLQTSTGYLNTNKLEITDLTSASGTLSDRLGSTGSNLLGQISSNDTDISALQNISGNWVPRSETGFLSKEITGDSYTLGVSDIRHYLRSSYTGFAGTGWVNVTLPVNTFTSGNEIVFFQSNTGKININPAANVTINSNGYDRTRDIYSAMTLVCVDDTTNANVFDLVGDLDGDTTLDDVLTASGYLNTGKSRVSITGDVRSIANLSGAGNVSVEILGSSLVRISGSTSASSDTASNLGNGSGLFAQKSAGDFQFKSLRAGPNITITGTTTELYISGAEGESTDLTNLETATGYLNTNKLEISDLTSASGTLSDRLGSTGSNLLGQITSNDADITNLQTASGYLNTNKSSVYNTGTLVLNPNLSGAGNVSVEFLGSDLVRISGVEDLVSNIGAGSGLFFQKNNGYFQFKTLRAGPNITITGTTSELYISGAQAGGSTDLTDLETATGYLAGQVDDLNANTGTLATDVANLQIASGFLSNNRSETIPAAAMTPSGASASTYRAANISVDALLFDGTIEESAFFLWDAPAQWNKGNIEVDVIWDGASGASANDWVQWNVSAGALGNDDSWWHAALGDVASGNAQLLATGDFHRTTVGGITVGGTPVAGDVVVVKLSRGTPTGSPSMAEDAIMFNAKLKYNI